MGESRKAKNEMKIKYEREKGTNKLMRLFTSHLVSKIDACLKPWKRAFGISMLEQLFKLIERLLAWKYS